jgi:hypothetical protein
MSVQLRRLLESVLENEPALGDEVDAVFRAADRLRRRRTRAMVLSGLVATAGIAAAGYLLTTTLLPAGGRTAPHAAPTSTAPPSIVADRVLTVVAPLVDGKGMHIYPRPPERGNGWRQYSVVDRNGKPRGTLDVAVYASPEDLCFPVPSAPGKCSHTEWAPRGIEYVRYDDERDPDWQVHQTIARRISDGRVVSVMASGERGTDNASHGKPGLSGAQVEKIATDPRLGDAFGPQERCTGPSAGACPAFKVPVPVAAD